MVKLTFWSIIYDDRLILVAGSKKLKSQSEFTQSFDKELLRATTLILRTYYPGVLPHVDIKQHPSA